MFQFSKLTLVASMTMALLPVSITRAQPDVGFKIRGEYAFYGAVAESAMRNAWDHATFFREYATTVPLEHANRQVANDTVEAIGDSISRAQGQMALLRQAANDAGDKAAIPSFDAIDKNLAAAATLQHQMRERASKSNVPQTAAADSERIGDSIIKALIEHGRLMKQLQEDMETSYPAPRERATASTLTISQSAAPSTVVLGVRLSRALAAEARVGSVEPGSIAERAGLRAGDQILSIDGMRIESRQEIWAALKHIADRSLHIAINRQGKVLQLSLGAMTPSSASADARIGVTMAGDEETHGVIIASLVPGGPADDVGLQLGDRLVAADGRPVATPHELQDAIHRHQPGEKIELRVDRGGWRRTFELILMDRKTLLLNASKILPPTMARQIHQTQHSLILPPPAAPAGYIDDPEVIRDPYLRAIYTNFD